MTYRVEITGQAEKDIKGIFEYLAYAVLAGENAVRQIERIEKAIYSLDEFPERHRQYKHGIWRDRNLRIMPADNFIVAYVVDDGAKTVYVIRVMYGGMDIDAALEPVQYLKNGHLRPPFSSILR